MTNPSITEDQRAALCAVAPSLDAGTYLVGGVAIALDLGHRTSLDVDLFVPREFDADRLAERLTSEVADLAVMGRATGTLHLEVSGLPVSILSYRYPLLSPLRAHVEVPVLVAAQDDLACMKVSAIAGRGAAKDFWDLDAMLGAGSAGGSLRNVLELYRRKYAREDVGHAVRSLAYFGDADASPLPRGLTLERWEVVKASMRKRVLEL